jgi:hypothetical protein
MTIPGNRIPLGSFRTSACDRTLEPVVSMSMATILWADSKAAISNMARGFLPDFDVNLIMEWCRIKEIFLGFFVTAQVDSARS